MDQVDIVARPLWREARGQCTEDMTAVACVITNRVARPCWRGRTPVGVCLKPYQFSAWNVKDPNCKLLLAVSERDPVFGRG